MPTAYDKGKNFPQDPMTLERRFTTAPLSSPWSAKEEEKEREGDGLGSRVGIAGFQIQI
jgi:hypothetical protein